MIKMKNKLKKKRLKEPAKTILKLVPLFYSLAISTQALGIMVNGIQKMFGEEIRIRSQEFKLMNVIEIEKRDRGKITIEYHRLKGIKKYVKNFIRRNPKFKSEYEVYGNIKTGRIILTRNKRKYTKKVDLNYEYLEDY